MKRLFRTYVGLVVAAAAVCLLTADWRAPQDSTRLWNAVASFAVLCFISEAYYFRLRVGRTETQSSVAFIPYIASFLLLGSGWASLVTGASMLAVEFGVRKKPSIKIIFNTAQIAVSIGLASRVFEALGGVPSIDLSSYRMTVPAVAASIATYFFINSTAVSLAVSLDLGEPLSAAWVRIAGASLLYDLFSSPLGVLLAYFFMRFQIPGILYLVLPILFVRHIYQVNLQLEQVNRDLLELMVKAIEARDPYTSGHSQRVSRLAGLLAHDLGLNAKHVEHIKTAALLHDVGKIHEEYAPLLRKEGKLDATEKALMQTHSTRSAELVGTISAFRGMITEAVRHHHENFDGTGYPSGLAGKSIPVGARIIMIADTVDAMTTDRPYRKALTFERVAQELDRFSSKQFDPQLVGTFLRSASAQEFVRVRAGAVAEPALEPVFPGPWRRTAKAKNVASSPG
ncbi:MAG: HD-GYP domain-containing protein [Terriglobales bacterium]